MVGIYNVVIQHVKIVAVDRIAASVEYRLSLVVRLDELRGESFVGLAHRFRIVESFHEC